MHDEPPPADTPVQSSARSLRPADPDDVKDALAFALRYRRRKRIDFASELVAQIAAENLFEHLRESGFVVMNMAPSSLGPDKHYAPSVERIMRRSGGEGTA